MSLFNKKPIKKILFVASEAAPFAKAGGLGEVMFSLPRSLNKLGYDARVMIPRYAEIDTHKYDLEIDVPSIMKFRIEGVEAENKQQAAIKFYQMLPENMKNWTPDILEHYIERTI